MHRGKSYSYSIMACRQCNNLDVLISEKCVRENFEYADRYPRHQFNLNTSLSNALTASSVAWVELAE
jgi:hypothetical protein